MGRINEGGRKLQRGRRARFARWVALKRGPYNGWVCVAFGREAEAWVLQRRARRHNGAGWFRLAPVG
jgi:hypothetical protein